MKAEERQLEPTPGWCERAVETARRMAPVSFAELIREYESAKPEPEPLPHEWVKVKSVPLSSKCRLCGLVSYQPLLDERPCKPATPESLPHEFVTYDLFPPQCRYCGILLATYTGLRPCPARQSSAEPAKPEPDSLCVNCGRPIDEWAKRRARGVQCTACIGYPIPNKPGPEAKDAELAEAIFEKCDKVFREPSEYRHLELHELCKLLLTEARRIAREELAAAIIEFERTTPGN